MRRKKQRNLLIAVICILAALLLAGLGLVVFLSTQTAPPENTTMQTDPSTAQTSAATTAPTTVPTTAPSEPTTEPTTVPTTAPTEPQPESFILSFAGDCTLGNDHGKVGAHTFIGTVGDNYAYPFSDVQPYFGTDDCSFINLEGPLSDRGSPLDKTFTFRGPSEYINILTEGSVEFANVINNHSGDYGQTALQDTKDLLDGAGIHYSVNKDYTIFTTESGLTIGVYTHNFPYDNSGFKTKFAKMRDEGAEIIVACFHWGEEYWYQPNGTQKYVARAAIDAGADIIWGHHPHVLQYTEEYNGGMIFYSLGNFSFGGNTNPADKDTAILQQEVIREVDGTVHLGELTIIPCYVTSIKGYGNDYKPTPMDPESEEYARVLEKLSGTYSKTNIPTGNRGDSTETVPETAPATEPVTTPTQTEATTPSAQATEPSDTPADPTETTQPQQTEPATEATEAATEATQAATEATQASSDPAIE